MASTGVSTATEAEKPPRPKGFRLLMVALRTRKSATMLGFGFSSGLPYALLLGTLNAWLGEVKIDLATIGVLSWIGLSYSFKFLWSPLVDRMALPGLEALGRRKSWILLCQIVLVLGFAGLAATDPAQAIGTFALFAFLAALASATQDVAVDAWRIDVADVDTPVELLSSIYQFGYRIASIVGGALALVMAGRMSWPLVYLLMAGLIGLICVVTLRAPDTPRPEQGTLHAALAQPGELTPNARGIALLIVGTSWAWAIGTIVRFMVVMLSPLGPGEKHPSVGDFTREFGPLIVAATVAVPLMVAAVTNAMRRQGRAVLTAPDTRRSAARTAANHLYVALIAPLAELVARLGWGVLVVIGMILTYNFVYADLAEGAVAIDAVGRTLGLHWLFALFGFDPRMIRLLLAISFENISTGIAGAAFVAYLSGIVSKQYTAVQYALMSSLTFLIGSLGRGIAGEAFDLYGYATVFRWTAAAGLVAVLFVCAEWVRVARDTAVRPPDEAAA